jgi:hypothetical protein
VRSIAQPLRLSARQRLREGALEVVAAP